MRKLIYSIIILIHALTCYGQNIDKLEESLDKFASDAFFKDMHLSFSLVNVTLGKQVLGLEETKPLVPASSLKLITNFSSLKILGSDYVYQTNVCYSGLITYDGTLRGDIVIISGGDPTLGSDKFKGVRNLTQLSSYIVDKIKAGGINCIEGKIILLNDYYTHQGPVDSWQWNDISNYYGAGAWSMNIHENLYSIYFNTKDKIGSTPKITKIFPTIPGLEIKNEISLSDPNSGDQAYVFGGPENYNQTIKGTLPIGHGQFSIKAAIPNPPLFFAEMMYSLLNDSGIGSFGFKLTTEYKDKLHLLCTIESPKLERIVYMSNVESNNLYSEALLKTIAKNKNRKSNPQDGLDEIKCLMKAYKLNTKDYKAVDGSGLSRQNFISAALMAEFLSKISTDLGPQKIAKLMAQPGQKGTLSHVMKNSKDTNAFRIKTGSMKAVQSYSGLVKSKDDQWFSFCLMANGFDCSNSLVRKKFDHFLTEIYALLSLQ